MQISYFLLPFIAFLVKTCKMVQLQCRTAESVYGRRLRHHVISIHSMMEPVDCATLCEKDGKCKSWNFWLEDKKCEMNDADRYNRQRDYQKRTGVIYSDSVNPEPNVKSCADVKKEDPGAPSGYYWIHLNKAVRVFCDMDNQGGGWTLVASISSQNNDHLQRAEHNCFKPDLCVPFANSTIPARKFSDEDIHKIAATEGTFRVDNFKDIPVNTVYYKIPSGVTYFNSSCSYGSCPRIVISYSFPHVWESNCKGTELGYKIARGCHAVFDGHDIGECGNTWHSSKYGSKRILYGYPCESKGLYENKEGLLFVK